jgi:hypothetical protein
MFKSADNSPVYQLKKHYPSIYETIINREIEECDTVFKQNIIKGIKQGLYREGINIDSIAKFHYTLIFGIKGIIISEKEAQKLELEILEYHTRAIATEFGVKELEKQLMNLEK